MRTEIVYEDDHILVCYKPAGFATQTAKVGQPDVVSELKNYLNRKRDSRSFSGGYLGIVHRLDQPVEGLLVFAKTKKSAAELSAQLSEGTLNKHYYAVICGQPSEKEGELTDYLAKTADNRAVISDRSEAADLKFQRAVLHYHIIASQSIGQTNHMISLADIHIETGRFHQIRAQMSHAGMPLLGDAKYGNDVSVSISGQLNVRGVALCAYEIELKHPVTGKRMHFAVRPRGEIFLFFGRY